MASAGVSLATIGGAFTTVPVVGWVVGLAAAVVDGLYIMPRLAGKGRGAAQSPRLQDVPVGSNEAGAPRIWAIGGRIRVPTHVLWQDDKTIEQTAGGSKGGGTTQIRRVYADALICVNDRQTVEITQLVGNGKLLVWTSRNLRGITTHEMTAAAGGANEIVVTMDDTTTPDPADSFDVHDFVRMFGWITSAGADVNAKYWRVKAVVGHTSTPGTITLEAVDGQVTTGVVATSGDAFTPGRIEIVDDAMLFDPATVTVTQAVDISGLLTNLITFTSVGSPSARDVFEVFNIGDVLRLVHAAAGTETIAYKLHDGGQAGLVFTIGPDNTSVPVVPALPAPGGTSWMRLEYFTPSVSASAFFEPGFVPAEHFHSGTETQGEDATLVEAKGTGNIPAYRGVAYQALRSFFVNDFGGTLPYSLEAIIRPDASMLWAQAAFEVLRRAGIPAEAIDTSGIDARPFLGFFMRGAVPTTTSMQPMLVAGQLVGQERDGTICIFNIHNADVVQIENGASFSEFGTRELGTEDEQDKVQIEDGAIEDLPTAIGVRHQDPDNAYADGYQKFGIRNPGGLDHQNIQELDLSTLALTRKDAANLAATTLRRAWVNNRTHRFKLPHTHLHLLENDLLTYTDDNGHDLTVRIIQRDIGSDFTVVVTAVEEDVELAVHGSPVQSIAGSAPQVLVTPPQLTTVLLDIPSLDDAENFIPQIRIACCANLGGQFAGATIFESFDGSTWTPIDVLNEQSVIGELTTQLNATVDSDPSEQYGTTTVTFFNLTCEATFQNVGAFGIASCTEAEALAGRNWCAIFDPITGEFELAAFTVANETAELTYDLGGWLRGLRGTKAVARSVGSQIVLLGPRAEYPCKVRQFPGLMQPTALLYRIVPVGLTIDDVDTVAITSSWRNARPLPIRKIAKTISGSPFPARFTTENWTRAHLPLGTLPPYPMDEPFEGYKLSIYDPTGAAIRRIKVIQANPSTGAVMLRDTWFDYPASEQTADGYTPASNETFIVDVQQIGAFGLSDSVKQEV